MEFESQKIVAVLKAVDGPRDKAFILEAFPEVCEAEIDGALVALALSGGIEIGVDGIRVAKSEDASDEISDARQTSPAIPPDKGDLWILPIESLKLRDPIVRNLNRSHIHSIQELIDRSEEDLMGLRGMGATKVGEVIDALAAVGLSLNAKHSEEPEVNLDLEPVSIQEWLSGLKDKHREIMEMRLDGKRLQQVGDFFEISRERVRQIESKALKRKPPLQADDFRHIFDGYDLSEDEFMAITGQPKDVYYYLKITSSAKREDKKPMDALLEDDQIPESYKRALRDSNVDLSAIYVDNQRIRRNKHDIAAYILKEEFDGGPLALSQLYDAYMAFIEEHALMDDKRLDPTSPRAFNALLERTSEMIITPSEETGEGGVTRSFDTSADFSLLEDALQKFSDFNVECSAAWLLEQEDIAQVAESLDIRSANELHVAINRYCGNIPGVSLGRMPIVYLGDGDRDEQVFALIKEMSPASSVELGDEYERRYGVDPATFRGTFLKDFSSYLHDGKYVYEPANLTDEQRDFIRAEIDRNGGYMPFNTLKEQFSLRFPDTSQNFLNTESLALAGCRISGKLVIEEGLDIASVFEGLIANNEYINAATPGAGEEVLGNQEFLSELNKELRRFNVVEYDKGNYLSTRILSELPRPVYPDDMRDFMESAIAFMQPGVPYTLLSLREAGFDHPLFELSNDLPVKDSFYESILSQGYVGGTVKRTPFENVVFFCRKDGWLSIADVLEFMFLEEGSMTLSDLQRRLKERFGLDVERSKLILSINRSDLSWDRDTGIVGGKTD